MKYARLRFILALALLAASFLPALPPSDGRFDAWLSAGRAAAAPNPIVAENQQPGSSGWLFTLDPSGTPMKAENHEIEGYASATSVNKGAPISFMVSLAASSQFTMDIYRMGWYPTGTNPDGTPCDGPCGGRLMQRVGPLNGVKQATCPTVTDTASIRFGMIECSWNPSHTLTVPTTWTTGNYIAKLRHSGNGRESYIPFTVRDDAAPADFVFVMEVTTWQAYNFWGGSGNNNIGYNLYGKFHDTNLDNVAGPAASAVSFDRPYLVQGETDGAGMFFVYDYPMVRWLEQQGYNVTYATDHDVETNPNLLSGRKAFLNVGHDEYYSQQMLDNVKGAIAAGKHMGLFSANNWYFRIRWENSVSGQPLRRIICAKNPSKDPTTLRFRDLSPPQPENATGGTMLGGVADNRPWQVADAAHWIFAGTGLQNYVSGTPVLSGPNQNAIAGLVGYEFDSRATSEASLSSFVSYEPAGLRTLAHSFVPAADNGVDSYSDATIYTAPSGAIVFSAGTMQWAWGVDTGMHTGYNDNNPNFANAKSQQITANLLAEFLKPLAAPAPAVGLNPTSLTFASQAVNTTSAAQAVTLTNTGNGALTISGIGLGGANAGDFAQTSTCPLGPATLAAGASCTISVTFRPTAGGSRTATLSIADNATGSPHTVALAGTGTTAPGVSLSPTSLSFDSQQIGETSPAGSVTLTNSGNAALTISGIGLGGANAGDFAQTNACPLGPATLAAGASCAISVTFTPTAEGARTASLTITDDAAGSPHTVALSGTGTTTPTPAVDLSPTSLTFPSQGAGTTSAAQTVTLTNSGNAALTIASIGLGGANAGDFAQTNACPLGPATLAAGASCAISVTFTPAASGSRTATLAVADDAAGSPHTVALTGTGATAPGEYLLDGFESGTLGAWKTFNSAGGTPGVQATVVNSGAQAGAAANTANSDYTALYANLTAPQTQTYSRFCFRLAGLSGTTMLAQGRDSTNTTVWEVDYNHGRRGLDIYFWNGARARVDLYSPGNLVQADTWYCAEVQANQAAAGHAEVWLNGTSVAQADADLSVTNAYSQLYLWNNGASGTIYYDDVKVADAYSGPVGAGAAPLPAPAVSLSPANVVFGDQAVNTTSASQTVTLTNSGAAPLAIGGISLTGAAAGDFAQTSTCPVGTGTLAAGASCAVSVTFTPAAAGERTATLAVTDDAAGSPHTVALAGSGVVPPAPAVTLSPASLAFTDQLVGSTSAAQTVTLTNSGNAALTISGIGLTGANAGDFGQTSTCPVGTGTLAAGASCAISVTFAPAAAGERTATLAITDNATGSPRAVPLTGSGTLPAGQYLSDGFERGLGGWQAFGPGGATAQTGVKNGGSGAAALTNAAGQYVAMTAPLLGGGQAQTYTRFCFRLGGVTDFTILAQGRNADNSGVWEVDYNAWRQGLDIYFWNGAGTRVDLYSPNGLVQADTWYCLEVRASETTAGRGEAWLNGTSLGTVDADLSVAQPYSQLYLWNNPAAGTVYFDDVQVADAYSGPVGAGAAPLPAPAVSLSPANVVFGDQAVNTTSASQTVTLTNSGTAPLTIGGIGLDGANTGDFAQTGTCPVGPATLAAGASCAISVTFTPTAAGARAASLSVADNAAGSPHTVALAGSGVVPPAPAVTLSPASLAFAGQLVGTTSAAQTVTLTNSGTAPLTIAGIGLGGTDAGDFAQTGTCPVGPATLAAGASCAISVTFTPTAAGGRGATLTVTDNAAGSPHTVALAGSGTLPAGQYLVDGFEHGLGGWTAFGPGSATTQTGVKHGGSAAAALTNTAGQYVAMFAPLHGGGQAQTYTRFCFRLGGLTDSTTLAQGRNADNAGAWQVDYSAWRQGLDLYFWNGTGARTDLYSPNGLLRPDTWHCLEIHANQTTAGRGEAWLDGVAIGAVDADLSTALPYSQIYLWNNPAAGTVYFDDVQVADAPIGPVSGASANGGNSAGLSGAALLAPVAGLARRRGARAS